MNFANRHPTCIEGQNLLVKPIPAGLVLGDDLGLKAAMAVARDFYGQLTEFALEGLAAFAVAGVASSVDYAVVFGVAQVLGHLGMQGALDQPFGELLE